MMDIESRMNEIFERIKGKDIAPLAVFQGMRGILRDLVKDRDQYKDWLSQKNTERDELVDQLADTSAELAELRAYKEAAEKQEPYGYIYDGQVLCDDGDFIDYFDGAHYDKDAMTKVYADPIPSAQSVKIAAPLSHNQEQQIPITHNGKTIGVDESIADFVRLLNSVGLTTIASCSGHGYRPANIALTDGREIIIARDFDEARKIDRIFPIDINGDQCNQPVKEAVIEENPHEWILENLSYHKFERDDLTIDECLKYLSSEWKEVRGRTERPLVMQILSLLATKSAQQVMPSTEAFETLMRDITEVEPANPEHDRTVCVDYDWLYQRIKAAFSEKQGVPDHQSSDIEIIKEAMTKINHTTQNNVTLSRYAGGHWCVEEHLELSHGDKKRTIFECVDTADLVDWAKDVLSLDRSPSHEGEQS